MGLCLCALACPHCTMPIATLWWHLHRWSPLARFSGKTRTLPAKSNVTLNVPRT